MRVIGGTFGGRRLRSVDGYVTRPTSDRVREAMFSRIEARYGFDGVSVLDVFSGTGALAIEALSRGARRAVCIELDRRALETLRGNLRDFDLMQRVRVMGDDYQRVLRKLAGEEAASANPGGPILGAGRQVGVAVRVEAGFTAEAARGADEVARLTTTRRRFDGVFVDPPYGKGLAVETLDTLARLGLVKDGGWVTVEVGRREETPETVTESRGILQRVREDAYGDTKLALYESCAAVTRNKTAGTPEMPAAEVDP